MTSRAGTLDNHRGAVAPLKELAATTLDTAGHLLDVPAPARSASVDALATEVRRDLAGYGVDLADEHARRALMAVAQLALQRSRFYGRGQASLVAYVGVVFAAALSAAEGRSEAYSEAGGPWP